MGKKSVSLGWNAASTMLSQVYRRFYRKNPQDLNRDIGELFDQIRGYADHRSITVTGEDVENAVKNYIYSDLAEHDDQGKFFPDLNTIVAEINFVQNRNRTKHHSGIEEARLSFDEQPFKEVAVKGTPMEKFFPKLDVAYVYDTSNAKCSTCKDNGRVRFYYVPKKPEHVFLGDEWLELHDRDIVKAEMFRCSECYCDQCSLGRLMWSKYRDNGNQAPPKLSEIIKLVELRKKRKKQRDIDRSIDDAGEQGEMDFEEEEASYGFD